MCKRCAGGPRSAILRDGDRWRGKGERERGTGEEGRDGTVLVLYHPGYVFTRRELEHAHEGWGALSVWFALDEGWPSRVTYFGSVLLALP